MRRKLLLTLAIVLLLCGSALATDISGRFTTGAAFTIDSKFTGVGSVMFPIKVSEKVFIVPGFPGQYEAQSEKSAYGFATQCMVFVTPQFAVKFGGDYLRTNIEIDTLTDIQSGQLLLGADYYFKDAIGENATNETLMGVSLLLVYDEHFKSFGAALEGVFWFGKN